MSTVDALVTFLRAQLAEDEHRARGALPAPWQSGDDDDPDGVHYGEFGWHVYGAGVEAEDSEAGKATAQHIARWDPDRVLAEVEAKRRIVDSLEAGARDPARLIDAALHLQTGVLRNVVLTLAQPYAGRPGFDPEWRLTTWT